MNYVLCKVNHHIPHLYPDTIQTFFVITPDDILTYRMNVANHKLSHPINTCTMGTNVCPLKKPSIMWEIKPIYI